MSVTQERRTTNGCCPACGHPVDQDFFLSNASGHLSDGLLFITCPNCQEQISVTLEFTTSEVVS